MFGLAVFITQNSISITQFSKSIDPAKIQVVWVSSHDLISITKKKKKKTEFEWWKLRTTFGCSPIMKSELWCHFYNYQQYMIPTSLWCSHHVKHAFTLPLWIYSPLTCALSPFSSLFLLFKHIPPIPTGPPNLQGSSTTSHQASYTSHKPSTQATTSQHHLQPWSKPPSQGLSLLVVVAEKRISLFVPLWTKFW